MNCLKLHLGQIKAWKEKCALNTIGSLIHKVQQRWNKKELVVVLLININKAFNHVFKTKLMVRIVELNIDGDLIQ